MANQIEKVAVVQKKLDELIVAEMTTAWMEVNQSQLQYFGGDEVKIPMLTVDGMGNYKNGYATGSATLKFQTKKMTQDRGRSFDIDVRDVDETAGIATIFQIMNEFQITQVIPEIDAYRISYLANNAIEAEMVKDQYVPKKETVIDEVKDAIKAIRKIGYNGELMIHANYDTITEIEKARAVVANTATITLHGVETRVQQIDGVPIIPTSDNIMVSKIKLNDGTTGGQEKGGFEKDGSGKTVNFLVVGKNVPIAVTKLDVIRVFDPMTNQTANGWKADYRRFHDIWVTDNKKKCMFVNIKEAKA